MSGPQLVFPRRRYAYPVFVTVVSASWILVMIANDLWHLLISWWEMPITMVFGSFVAGFTATGGSAIAFPVFTKLLEIPSTDARMFGLMIQSFGMTAASIYIWSRRIPFLIEPVKWGALGSAAGITLSTTLLPFSGSSAKLLFTAISSLFALVVIWNHWFGESRTRERIARWGPRQSIQFFVAGLIGGVFSESTGCGTDMMVFALLTLIYRIDEHISIPTSVIVMAVTSVFGFATHGMLIQDIGPVWEYWLVCIPVVIVGAPLGAMMLTRISHTQIVVFLCTLIALEVASTILFVPIDQEALVLVLPMSLGVAMLLAVTLIDKNGATQVFLLGSSRISEATLSLVISIFPKLYLLAETTMMPVFNRIGLYACNVYLRFLLAANQPKLFRILLLQDWHQNLLEQWISDIDIKASDTVLDAGCGPGLLTHGLSGKCRLAVGADLSPSMLSMANEEQSSFPGRVGFVRTDASTSGFGGATFDVVLASSLINIVPSPITVVMELGRIAKPGAVVSLLFPIPTMTKTNVTGYLTKHDLSVFASALLTTWQSQAPKTDPDKLAVLLAEQGIDSVRRVDYLDGMAAAVSFRAPSADMESVR